MNSTALGDYLLDSFGTGTATLRGLDFKYFKAGSGDRLILYFHGFPDSPRSSLQFLSHFDRSKFTVVAPYLRGYGESDAPIDGNYQINELARDVLAFADLFDLDETILIGHDWGAVATYLAAVIEPERVDRIVTMAVPPIPVLLQNIVKYPPQIARSWYMLFFQLPWLPEYSLRMNNFSLIEYLWSSWSPGLNQPELINSVKKTFKKSGTVKSSLGYYRGLLRNGFCFFSDYIEGLNLSYTEIRIPALLLGGADDGCIDSALFNGYESCFEGPVKFELIENAGHFMQIEKPEDVYTTVSSFLSQ